MVISPVFIVVQGVIQMQSMTRDFFNEFHVYTAQQLNDEETHFLFLAEHKTQLMTFRQRFLNPVEQAIIVEHCCLKANIKADSLRPQIQYRMNDRLAARN